ncbi:MAG: protein phosphatase CheZ [Pseudomonadota bacterium]
MTDTAEVQSPVDMRLSLAKSLVTSLENGEQNQADQLINNLVNQHESVLFQEIGKLTRQLHDTMENFRNDNMIVEIAEERIPNARERLTYVIDKTEESAHKTLNAVEEALPVATELQTKGTIMHANWNRFTRREMSVEEFKEMSKQIESFLTNVEEDSKYLNEKLSDIMMAQDFQDITGQIIRHVITLVQDMEEGLVGVIKRSSTGKLKQDKDIDIKAEGPQVNQEENPNVLSGQDDVDDLLSSLGF